MEGGSIESSGSYREYDELLFTRYSYRELGVEDTACLIYSVRGSRQVGLW